MSCSFLALRDDLGRTIVRYFSETQEAERRRTTEAQAARIIQRHWRAYNARTYIRYLSEQATQVQRIWRGYMSRKRCDELLEEQSEREMNAYYFAFATLIQKRWRGYRSRKEREDFYKRAQWVHTVTKKSQVLSKTASAHAAEQYQYNMEKKQNDAAAQFESLAGSLHHLVSTKSIPGIFKPTFAGQAMERSAYEIPMDEHLWGAFKNTYNSSTSAKTRELPSYAGTKTSLPAVRPKSGSKKLSKSTRKIGKKTVGYQSSHAQFKASGKQSRHRPKALPPARYPTQPVEAPTPPKLGNPRYAPRRIRQTVTITQGAVTGAPRREQKRAQY